MKVTAAFLIASLLGISAVATTADVQDRAAIVHILNRAGFGPRPGDIERVQRQGLGRYLAEQLTPARTADETLSTRLAPLSTLTMSARDIARQFELPLIMARRDRAQGRDAAPPASRQRATLPLIELSQAKLLRAVYSDRQLEEVLTDFWFNHFNVDARKGPGRFTLTSYERDVIRPHVLGRFRDLLEATAKSPSMLFYLDNWMSAAPNAPTPRGRFGRRAPAAANPAAAQNQMRRGLNENYARELMELHTLGVDGGYTQRDVTEVARAFTGWTIDQPRAGGGYRFVPRLHDNGEKHVLGHRIAPGGGERDGEEVLDILASHPSTARFIAKKLAVRFVSDTPAASLVDRVARRFTQSGGDLRAVMTELLTSPEFQAAAARNAKVKTPFEFVASALRATGAEVNDAAPLVRVLQQQLGMPLYQCQPPTGYKETADAWVNTGALVSRMNLALVMASGRMPGVRMPTSVDPEALPGLALSETTKATMAKATRPEQALALALGSPEFQRR